MRLRSAAAASLTVALASVVAACGSGVVAPSGPVGPSAGASSPTSAPSSAWVPSDLPTIGTAADSGARIVKVEDVDARTRDLTIESPSVGTVKVRLLLPPAFDANATAVFPALYLLHGADGEYSDWTTKADVETTTADADVLVVMPAGASSFVGEDQRHGSGPGGAPEWMPFHATELTQLMERNWRASDVRALAGLSLGGYEAIALAATHPGLYQAVASYSGALDIAGAIDARAQNASPELQAKLDPILEAAQQIGIHTLAEMAPLLRGTKSVFVSYGNGEPGPLDPPDQLHKSPLEVWCGGGSDLFVSELKKAGIPVIADGYGDGTHSWPYWDRELRESLPMLLEAVGAPVPPSLAAPSPAPSAGA